MLDSMVTAEQVEESLHLQETDEIEKGVLQGLLIPAWGR